MAKINILPSKVYNRIAAGEVVDRPCSVVKELVENAIDAGATEIEIHIEQGGKQLIRVIDNGCGIEREDLQSAFLPHATSKISKAEDLDSITTLGFRGEAIASISAVSKMTITSKTEEGKCYKLSCNGGELGQITEASGEKGTDVVVETLFFHTPVRLGFLKSDKVEETEITNFVSRFILNRSDISFTYYANGKKVLQSFGGGDEEAMVSVYGASVLSECFCVNAVKHGVRIRGYIGNQNYFKANKSYQSVFLNGRYIVNATISAAISNAYASYLMKRQYPFYVLHIDIPTEIVDVNVHPNKSDVRFADNQIVYGCIYSVISAVLDGNPKAMEYVVKAPTKGVYAEMEPTPAEVKAEETPLVTRVKEAVPCTPKTSVTPGMLSLTYEQAQKEIEESAPAFTAKKKGVELELPFDDVKEGEEEPRKYRKGFIPNSQLGPVVEDFVENWRRANAGSPSVITSFTVKGEKELTPEEKEEVKAEQQDAFMENKRFLEELDRKINQDQIEISNCVYVGKLFNTYLLYEVRNTVYIIDQHAAHERLIFDRLRLKMEERTIVRQPMLLPFSMSMNAFEGGFIRENMHILDEMGFTVTEPEENTFAIMEIPVDLSRIDLNSFMHALLGEINGLRAIKLENLVKDRLAAEACKAAVKGGRDLTRDEIDTLFLMMDGNMGLKCPHGRPVVVKMTKIQLEKMFKRIV